MRQHQLETPEGNTAWSIAAGGGAALMSLSPNAQPTADGLDDARQVEPSRAKPSGGVAWGRVA